MDGGGAGQSASTPQDDHTQPNSFCLSDYPTLRKVMVILPQNYSKTYRKKHQVIPFTIKAT